MWKNMKYHKFPKYQLEDCKLYRDLAKMCMSKIHFLQNFVLQYYFVKKGRERQKKEKKLMIILTISCEYNFGYLKTKPISLKFHKS